MIDYKLDYKEKVRKILKTHKVKMANKTIESPREIRLISYALFLKNEIDTISKLKPNKERRYLKATMLDLIDQIYFKYYLICYR